MYTYTREHNFSFFNTRDDFLKQSIFWWTKMWWTGGNESPLSQKVPPCKRRIVAF